MLLSRNILNKMGFIEPLPLNVSRYSYPMDIQKLQRLVIDALEDVKEQDIKIFNKYHIKGRFDRVVIASGQYNRQPRSLAYSMDDSDREHKIHIIPLERDNNDEWIC